MIRWCLPELSNMHQGFGKIVVFVVFSFCVEVETVRVEWRTSKPSDCPLYQVSESKRQPDRTSTLSV